jgi:predicted PurR-regulated permease PerM
MLRKVIWFIVVILIAWVVYYAYQYNTELQNILSNIKFSDVNSLIDKAKDLNDQLSGALSVSGSDNILSGTETIISGVVNTLSGTVAEITSGANNVLSGTIN